jgi:N-acetylmuramoyl-L-alanine amidase
MFSRTVPGSPGRFVRFRCVRWRGAVVLGLAALALVSQSTLASGAAPGPSGPRHTAPGRAIDTRYFEPGACVEFPPTAGDRHLTVFLDAGHGGLDPGGVGET